MNKKRRRQLQDLQVLTAIIAKERTPSHSRKVDSYLIVPLLSTSWSYRLAPQSKVEQIRKIWSTSHLLTPAGGASLLTRTRFNSHNISLRALGKTSNRLSAARINFWFVEVITQEEGQNRLIHQAKSQRRHNKLWEVKFTITKLVHLVLQLRKMIRVETLLGRKMGLPKCYLLLKLHISI